MSREVHHRAVALTIIASIAVLALVAQLANLQIVHHDRYAGALVTYQERTMSVPAPRGEIRDRNGVPLATNRPANAVYIRYPFYKDQAVLALVAEITGRNLQDLQRVVQNRKDPTRDGRLYEPVPVKLDITREQYARIIERRADLPGVEMVVRPVREYPQGERAAHVVGYVNAIGELQLADYQDRGYRGDEIVGQDGLEHQYEDELRGREGVKSVKVDVSFAPIGEPETVQPPVPGNDLVLTLDTGLQAATERALAWQMWRIQNIPNFSDKRAWPAVAGAAVVMDVKTGAILALASTPGFNPNIFVSGADAAVSEVMTSELGLLINRGITGRYHPGSTWKMVTASAALDFGVNQWETVTSTPKYIYTGQAEWNKVGFGPVHMRQALQYSSDIYFYDMGRRLGIDNLVQWARNYGFGAPTGLDLPYEGHGFLPDQAWRAANDRVYYLGDITTAAIGQIFETTLVQLARYTAAIANGGNLMQPYLVQEVRDHQGRTVKLTQPRVAATVPRMAEFRPILADGMLLVNSPQGTSDFAGWPLPGIKVAGKTGSAERTGGIADGLYVAYAPADDPQVAVAVLIEQAEHGSSVSPVARTILAEYFKVTLPANDPARVPAEWPARAEDIKKTLLQGKTWP